MPTDVVMFGKDKWEKYFGTVDNVPPIPKYLLDILSSDCPYFTTSPQKVMQTHMLALVPTQVNGNPFTLSFFKSLVKHPLAGNSNSLFIDSDLEQQLGNIPVSKAYWVLMVMNAIPHSSGKTYAEQQALIANDYEVPDMLSAVVSILTHYVETGKCLFDCGKHPCFIRCRESVVPECQVVVGQQATSVIYIQSEHFMPEAIGFAPIQKFF